MSCRVSTRLAAATLPAERSPARGESLETRGAYDHQVQLNTRRLLAGHFDVPERDQLEALAVRPDELPPGEVSRVQLEREASIEGRMYDGLNLRYYQQRPE